MITTQEIFVEFLAHFSGFGQLAHEGAVHYFESVLNDPEIAILPQTPQSFLDGFTLYKARPDKQYSLTDCISMEATRRESITEILTHDKHFAQEGFTILI